MTTSHSEGNPGSPSCFHNPRTTWVIGGRAGVPAKEHGGMSDCGQVPTTADRPAGVAGQCYGMQGARKDHG